MIGCIKGDHMIIPGVLDQGAMTEPRPVLLFLDERRWKEGMPLHCLQCAPGFSTPARRWGTTPCHRAQKANTETITKPNTYPSNRHGYSHPRLYFLLCPSFLFFHAYTNKRPESLVRVSKFTGAVCLEPSHACWGC